MSLEGIPPKEIFATLLTLEMSLSSVYELMSFEMLCSGKAFATDAAAQAS